MKIIISPAKKMNVDTNSLPVKELPVFLNETKIICNKIQKMKEFNCLGYEYIEKYSSEKVFINRRM